MDTLPDLMAEQASVRPRSIALRSPSGALTCRALVDGASALAATLKQKGLNRLGLCGDNTMAWIVADLACLIAGIVCVPVPAFFSKSQVDHLIALAGLEGLIWSGNRAGCESLEYGAVLQTLPVMSEPARIPEGTAKITFTSGSTGTPKGVCLSAGQMTATTLALRKRLENVPLTRHLCILPLATLLENIAGVYLPLVKGATVKLAPLASVGLSGSSGLDGAKLVATLNRVRPESAILVPELAATLVEARASGHLEPGDFRFLAVGGGKVSRDLLTRGRAAGLPLYEGYGLSECGSVVALNVPGDDQPGSVGRPLGHVKVEVDRSGEILVRGGGHLGYLGDAANPGEVLATGDLGRIDDRGHLYVNGRSKNLLITSFGRNINPEWLESELVHGLGIREAVVFGDGEPNPMALVTVADGRSPDALSRSVQQLNQHLPDYAQLATVYIRRQPLSRSEGYITDNGRPVRARIQADLPTLLADAVPVSVSTSLTSQPGESHMAFFGRLQQETAQVRLHVTEAPVIQAIGEGRFSLESYIWFLTQAYHHVRHTVPLMMACGARLPERMEFVRKGLVDYINEEYGHHEWILDDLEACGADRKQARNSKPDLSIELMVSYLYDQIGRVNPAAFFGMVQVLEGTSVELATPLGEKVQELLGLPTQAFRYLYSHGALDQEHFEFFRNLMNDISDPGDQQAIIDAACVVYRLYGDMLRSIPLPADRTEHRHEAA